MHLRVDNVSRLPTGLLMLQDRVPYVLGPRPRFVLDRVEPGGHREVSYRVRSDLRGRYPLGPLQLRLTDPFGMCELTRSFSDARHAHRRARGSSRCRRCGWRARRPATATAAPRAGAGR